MNQNDPRLTAYALGELTNPKDRAEVEAAIRENPKLARHVEELRELGNELSDAFAHEPMPEADTNDSKNGPSSRRRTPPSIPVSRAFTVIIAFTGLAASVLLALMFIGTSVSRPTVEVTQDMSPRAEEKRETPEPPQMVIKDKDGDDYALRNQIEGFPPPPASEPELRALEGSTLYSGIDLDKEMAEIPAVNRRDDRDYGYRKTTSVTAPRIQETLADVINSPSSRPAGKDATSTQGAFNTESYDALDEPTFKTPLDAPLSTFSIDVDTASYANVRRFLTEQGQLPPAGAVRIEELVNYFKYDDAAPDADAETPFAANLQVAAAPWNPEHALVRIGIKGREIDWSERPASNLVFLIDVSGSMNHANKLPLVKQSLEHLITRLDRRDRVAIITYAGSERVALPSTTADNTETIRHAISQLGAGGSTHASAGIDLAYETARKHFIEGGNNRVLICTDGDFNVGVTNRSELKNLIAEQAASGVYLSVLGFGMGNYKDDTLEELSNRGNGNYAYIDSDAEARKALGEDLAGTLLTIAKDVKIQVEFNPAHVAAYRLIGYENRVLAAEDFNDDKKDAGEIGASHSVVALYEIVPAGVDWKASPQIDDLKYQSNSNVEPKGSFKGEWLTLKMRYKQPDSETSTRLEQTLTVDSIPEMSAASSDMRWTAAVAAFGMRLRESEWLPKAYDWSDIRDLAQAALPASPDAHRLEFLQLVTKAGAVRRAED